MNTLMCEVMKRHASNSGNTNYRGISDENWNTISLFKGNSLKSHGSVKHGQTASASRKRGHRSKFTERDRQPLYRIADNFLEVQQK